MEMNTEAPFYISDVISQPLLHTFLSPCGNTPNNPDKTNHIKEWKERERQELHE